MAVQFYEVLTEAITTNLSAQAISTKKSEAITAGIISSIKSNLAGHQFYFKSPTKKDTSENRHKDICNEFTGDNGNELMVKYGISHSWFKTILKRGGCNEKAF